MSVVQCSKWDIKIFPAEDTGLSLDDYEMSMVNVVFDMTKFPTLVWVASFL